MHACMHAVQRACHTAPSLQRTCCIRPRALKGQLQQSVIVVARAETARTFQPQSFCRYRTPTFLRSGRRRRNAQVLYPVLALMYKAFGTGPEVPMPGMASGVRAAGGHSAQGLHESHSMAQRITRRLCHLPLAGAEPSRIAKLSSSGAEPSSMANLSAHTPRR
jgi:hypothetical protein